MHDVNAAPIDPGEKKPRKSLAAMEGGKDVAALAMATREMARVDDEHKATVAGIARMAIERLGAGDDDPALDALAKLLARAVTLGTPGRAGMVTWLARWASTTGSEASVEG